MPLTLKTMISIGQHITPKRESWTNYGTKTLSNNSSNSGSLKWSCVGHVARYQENWTEKVKRWRPWGEGRNVEDHNKDGTTIKKNIGHNWYQLSENKETEK